MLDKKTRLVIWLMIITILICVPVIVGINVIRDGNWIALIFIPPFTIIVYVCRQFLKMGASS